MLPGTTLVAGDPRLIGVIVVLRSCTADATDDLFVLFMLVLFLGSLLGAFLGLASLWRFGPILELVESFRVLALGGTYGSTGLWFTCEERICQIIYCN